MFCFFFNGPATTEIYTLSLHDALPISTAPTAFTMSVWVQPRTAANNTILSRSVAGPFDYTPTWQIAIENRSEEHTSELQSQSNLVCRLLLEKKKKSDNIQRSQTSHHVT